MTVPALNEKAAVIELSEVGKTYAGRQVLQALSFRVHAAEIFAVVGPNGAGKTTMVELIEGYRQPDHGTVRVLGADPRRAGRAHRARVGVMLQSGGGIDPRLTAREVVHLHGRFHAEPRDTDELCTEVGLTASVRRTHYRRLSGGEKQRVGLALALVGRPDLAILDEPTAGLDVEARGATRELLAGLRAAGVTVVLTSHDLADVERLADRIAILDRGRIVALGSPAELTAKSSHGLRFRLATVLSEADRETLAALLGQDADDAVRLVPEGHPGGYRLEGRQSTPAVVAALAQWCAARGAQISEMSTGGGTLEERYLELTRGSADNEPAPANPPNLEARDG